VVATPNVYQILVDVVNVNGRGRWLGDGRCGGYDGHADIGFHGHETHRGLLCRGRESGVVLERVNGCSADDARASTSVSVNANGTRNRRDVGRRAGGVSLFVPTSQIS
jgi:hypothetical protein